MDTRREPISDRQQINELLPQLYDELRRLAAAQMAHRQPETLQPTALVHEAWLRLGGSHQPDWENRAHFFAAAAEVMRHILIDRARRRRALRHGGGQLRLDVEGIDIQAQVEDDDRLIALSDAVERLAVQHPQMADLVKLRCFVGLEITEAATALGISRATANRWWLFARTWLNRAVDP